MGRITLDEVRTRTSTVDRAKVDATTDADIERHMAEDDAEAAREAFDHAARKAANALIDALLEMARTEGIEAACQWVREVTHAEPTPDLVALMRLHADVADDKG